MRKRRRCAPLNPPRKSRRVEGAQPISTTSPISHPSSTASLPISSAAPSQSYEYGGISCSCTAACHVLNPTLPPGSPDQIDDACAFMTLLHLKFHRYHRYLICPCGGGSFLNISNLLAHYRAYHFEWLIGEVAKPPARSWSILHWKTFNAQIVEHLSKCLGIPINQDRQRFTEDSFKGPIFGLSRPERYPRCLECLVCFKNTDTMRVHRGTQHKNCPTLSKVDYETVWCQPPYSGGSRCMQYVTVSGPLPDTSPTYLLPTLNHIPTTHLCLQRHILLRPMYRPQRGLDLSRAGLRSCDGWLGWTVF